MGRCGRQSVGKDTVGTDEIGFVIPAPVVLTKVAEEDEDSKGAVESESVTISVTIVHSVNHR